MDTLIEALRTMGPWSPVVVFVSATAESAGFVGLFVPGELLTMVGGAIAGLGETPLAAVIVAAVLGAFCGDSIGFWIGHRFGAQLLDRPALKRARPAFRRAGQFIESHRRWSIVAARFTPMIRSLVPMAAGAGGMPFRRFVLPNAVGGTLWGVAISSIGFWAGARWEVIQATIQQGMWLFAALGLATGTAVSTTRWIARHPDRVRWHLARTGDRRWVGRVVHLAVSSWGQPRPFLRVIPHVVVLGAALAAMTIAAWIDLSFFEARFVSWMHDQIAQPLRAGLRTANAWFGIPALSGALLLSITLGLRRPWGRLIAASCGTAAAMSLIGLAVIERNVGWIPPEWRIEGSGFPDLRSALATSLILAVAWPWTRRWEQGTRQLALGLTLAIVLSATAVGSDATYPIDALAGVCAGLVSILISALWIDPRIRTSFRIAPAEPPAGLVSPPQAPAPPRTL